jgi:hypothetical protein
MQFRSARRCAGGQSDVLVSLKPGTKIAFDKESSHWGQSTSSSEAAIAYRYKQAIDCFGASQSARIPEVRKAFLELEQGWLQLIPRSRARKTFVGA